MTPIARDVANQSDAAAVVETRDVAEAVRWVFDRLAVNVAPDDAPSSGASAMLTWARGNTDRFYSQYAPLLLKEKQVPEQAPWLAPVCPDDDASLAEFIATFTAEFWAERDRREREGCPACRGEGINPLPEDDWRVVHNRRSRGLLSPSSPPEVG